MTKKTVKFNPKISTPPLLNNEKKSEYGYFNFNINVKDLLNEIRTLMNKTINEFVYELGWPNEKYYAKIVNGIKIKNQHKRKYSNPTINYVFGGINHAVYNFADWKAKQKAIKKIIIKYILIEFNE